MAGTTAATATLRALREMGGQSAVLSAPAAAPVASRNLEEAKIRAKHLFREVRVPPSLPRSRTRARMRPRRRVGEGAGARAVVSPRSRWD